MQIVTAVLDNVALPSALHQDDEDDGNHSPGPVDRAVAAVKDAYEKIKDKNRGVHIGHGEKDPGDVAQYCVQNMARLAKEVSLNTKETPRMRSSPPLNENVFCLSRRTCLVIWVSVNTSFCTYSLSLSRLLLVESSGGVSLNQTCLCKNSNQ